ncbi:MAG: hypothetical protein COT81_04625 [Candidatus Buchananbacteria bacterium CG10_big_fil_rev_8_21_14_0_10_42_9]|uniref:Glycosyl transferase family 1 domain-containing protein n=1 Tax=Candidatus Buchananbacteria bacterium CG10_big_fil_rev_8_21_14_0_10_42_9 TaxID=1974526 RepID=A0A2H0W0C7_9BACT|nr:MAG: hypothetical protein COT81_04625 [Candidatus Buchananbacteria bacterium CG10_big_fil_rev_8_21_14_0_10_42_9]
MKLLMVTRKVDKGDALAGFSYTWVKKIAQHVNDLKVICLEKGNTEGLPDNVKIYSLGKEGNNSRFARFKLWNKYCLKHVSEVDGIFCHQNPEYTIAMWPYALLRRKKIISWYTHRAVTWKTKLMAMMAAKVLTASVDSFRINTAKKLVVGHGIDLDRFKTSDTKHVDERFNIVTVGRISPTKDYETMILAVKKLVQENDSNIHLSIIGGVPIESQRSYYDALLKIVANHNLRDNISFKGWVPNEKIVDELKKSDLFINLSGTGSLDKAILEAMAARCLVLTSNEAFKDFLPVTLMVEANNPEALARKISELMRLPTIELENILDSMFQVVSSQHNLDNLVKKIIQQFGT